MLDDLVMMALTVRTTVRVVVAQHSTGVSERSVFTMKRGGKANHPFVKRGGYGNDFKGGTWLSGVGNRTVTAGFPAWKYRGCSGQNQAN